MNMDGDIPLNVCRKDSGRSWVVSTLVPVAICFICAITTVLFSAYFMCTFRGQIIKELQEEVTELRQRELKQLQQRVTELETRCKQLEMGIPERNLDPGDADDATLAREIPSSRLKGDVEQVVFEQDTVSHRFIIICFLPGV